MWKDILSLGFPGLLADNGCVFTSPSCNFRPDGRPGVIGPLSTNISFPSLITATLNPLCLAAIAAEEEVVPLALPRPGVIHPPEAVNPADQILFIPGNPAVAAPESFVLVLSLVSFNLARVGAIDIPLDAAVEENREDRGWIGRTGADLGPPLNGDRRLEVGVDRFPKSKGVGGPRLGEARSVNISIPSSCSSSWAWEILNFR
jgi:hypothetical protein